MSRSRIGVEVELPVSLVSNPFSIIDYLEKYQVVEPQSVPLHPADDPSRFGWVWYGADLLFPPPVISDLVVRELSRETITGWHTNLFPRLLDNGLCFLLPLDKCDDLFEKIAATFGKR